MRNYFLRAMEKLAKPMVGLSGSGVDPSDLAQNPLFQDALVEILGRRGLKIKVY